MSFSTTSAFGTGLAGYVRGRHDTIADALAALQNIRRPIITPRRRGLKAQGDGFSPVDETSRRANLIADMDGELVAHLWLC